MTSNPSLPHLSLSPFAVPSISSSPPRSSPAARQLSYPTQESSPTLRWPPSPPSTGGPLSAGVVPPAASSLPRSLSGTSSLAMSATSANTSSSTLMKSPSSELGSGYSHPPASSGRTPNGGKPFKSRVRTSTAGRYQPNGPLPGHQHGLSDDDEEEEYDSDDELRRRAQSQEAGGREGGPYNLDDDDDLPEVIVKFSPKLAGDASSSSEDESSEDDGRSTGLDDDDDDDDDDDWPSSDPLAMSHSQHSTQSSANGASTGSHGERSSVKPSLSLSKIALLDEQAIATARAKILGVATTLLARPSGDESGGLGFGDVEDESTPRFGRSESQSSELFKAAGAGEAAAESARSLAPPAISVGSLKHAPIKIAVVGRARAGKSTLIEKAFTGWPLSPANAVAPGVEMRTARPELKSRIPQLVQLYEVDSSELETGADGRLRMPKECGDVEALVVCFDAGDKTSLGGVEALCRLQDTGIPFLVFACKAAGAPRPKEVDIAGLAAKIGRLIEISLERDATREQKGKGKYHQAFSFLLREAYNRRHGTYSPLPPTPNPTVDKQTIDHPAMRGPPPSLSVDTNAGLQPPMPVPVPLGPSSGHKPNDSESSVFSTTSQQRLADELLYPPSSGATSLRQSKDSPATTTPGESVRGPWVVEDDGLGSQYSLPKPESKERDRNGNLMFFTLPELLGQLWLNAFTGDLHNFHKYFFWSYRRFARPRDVLRFIGTEMTKLDDKELAGTYGQHKWCSILAWWIDNHPRDFAAAGTQVAFDDLFNVIEDRSHLAHFRDRFLPFACRLDQLVPEELPWAIADVDDELSPAASHAPLEPDDTSYPDVGVMVSTTTTISYAGSSASVDNLLSTVAEHSSSATAGSQRAASGSAPATRPASTTTRSRHDSSTSRKSASSAGDSSTALSFEQNLAKAVSNGSGSAQTSTTSAPSLGPSSLGDPWESRALVRIVNRFNDTSDLQIANDITRLVWRYFSRIEPRDVLTHVLSGSSEGQDTPVGWAMRHFYDISAVFDDVSNLFVLLIYSQNKTKLRARMFERIIRIVHLLRTQNNYIALLAGMTALSDVWMGRLKTTKELAQDALEKAGESAVFKKFQSHFRLIENRQNYKNYRLAVKEDESAQRPAIPLMPVIIADVNRIAQTDDRRKADGAIVWSKFDKFGQVLLAMVDNQARGCPVAPGGAANVVEGMLKDKPDIDERILYRRCDVLAADEQSTNSISSAFRKYFPKTHD